MTLRAYQEARTNGRPANARVRGILRGGYVYKGAFWYPAATNIGIQRAPVEGLEITYHDEVAR